MCEQPQQHAECDGGGGRGRGCTTQRMHLRCGHVLVAGWMVDEEEIAGGALMHRSRVGGLRQ